MIEAIFMWMAQLYDALQATTSLSPWVYLLVAAGGIVSALSPCYVPVLTMFGGYVGGYARGSKTAGLRLALPFVLGNAVTLGITGAVASLLGSSALQLFTGYQLDRWIPGLIGLVMALQLLGIVRIRMPASPIFRWARRPSSAWGSLALGLPFGLVVTPCTIPIFVAIVAFVALQASTFHGALLMVAYALGRGAILTAVAVSVGLLKTPNIGRTSYYFERLSGAVILVASVGLLLFYRDFAQFTGRWLYPPYISEATQAQSGPSYDGLGLIVSLDEKRGTITLKHDEIKGLMPAMIMEFAVKSPALLRSLRQGDKVRFTLASRGGDFIVEKVQKEQ